MIVSVYYKNTDKHITNYHGIQSITRNGSHFVLRTQDEFIASIETDLYDLRITY